MCFARGWGWGTLHPLSHGDMSKSYIHPLISHLSSHRVTPSRTVKVKNTNKGPLKQKGMMEMSHPARRFNAINSLNISHTINNGVSKITKIKINNQHIKGPTIQSEAMTGR